MKSDPFDPLNLMLAIQEFRAAGFHHTADALTLILLKRQLSP